VSTKEYYAAYQRARRARLKAIAAEAPHGTTDGYTNWMCRCDDCRKAMTAAHLDWRQRVKERPIAPEMHGRANTYNNYGCRCAPCTTARTDYIREWRAARRRAS
jgi:hypothetical protein